MVGAKQPAPSPPGDGFGVEWTPVGPAGKAEASPSRGLSSAERERVERDPLVAKVKEAVDGMLLDIRPPKGNSDAGETLGETEDADGSE